MKKPATILPGIDLAALKARLKGKARTRFAPSPTGHLHAGHVVNALYTWEIANALEGDVLLRIEDHDQGRYRPEYETSILDDLEWLGFSPTVNKIADFRQGETPFRQSNNQDRYRAALKKLRKDGHLLYACECSRKQIVSRTGQQGGELVYDGFCRHRKLEMGPGRNLRLAWEGPPVTFEDARLGPQTQQPDTQTGDLQIIDKQGQWSYQFAVTVDDWEQGVNLVIRGEDLLSSTGRQIRLASILGREKPPVFFHHPLLYEKDSDQKLSKRQKSSGIGELRRAGKPAQELLDQVRAMLFEGK